MSIKLKDDYEWEIPSKKSWQAYESLKEEMGAEQLFLEMQSALGKDDWKELIADVARDYDEETDNSDELLEYLDFEEILDDLARKLSSDDLAENIAYICRMSDIHIPELKKTVDDALWKEADNESPDAGRLTLKRPIVYASKERPEEYYLILTRKDGMFDVYTRGDFDLVGTRFKTIEEAKKNIDEGRTDEHVVTPEENLDDPETEGGTKKPDPENKQVVYKGFRLKKLPTNEWLISSAGEGIGMQTDLARRPSFKSAVEYLFTHTTAKVPTGTDKVSQLLKEYWEA